MRSAIIALGAVLGLSACGSQPLMVKWGVSPAEAARDDAQCTYEAQFTPLPNGNPILGMVLQAQTHELCLAARGYVKQASR